MHVTDLFSLKNKIAIVTGGGTGLGKQMAIALAEAGADLVITSRKVENCEKVASFIRHPGNEAIAIKMDVTKLQQVKQMVRQVIDKFGHIDILVNNVGIAKPSPIITTTLRNWNEVFAVNITGMFLCCKEVGKYMIKRRKGKIINIASQYGVVGIDPRPYMKHPKEQWGHISYSSSKGAVVNFTRDLAVNWAQYGINVNCITPGGSETRQTRGYSDEVREKLRQRVPLGRRGREDDLKGAVVFLASAASDYVVGHNLVVDGGFLAW